jgi:hypothetical protein
VVENGLVLRAESKQCVLCSGMQVGHLRRIVQEKRTTGLCVQGHVFDSLSMRKGEQVLLPVGLGRYCSSWQLKYPSLWRLILADKGGTPTSGRRKSCHSSLAVHYLTSRIRVSLRRTAGISFCHFERREADFDPPVLAINASSPDFVMKGSNSTAGPGLSYRRAHLVSCMALRDSRERTL